MTALLKYGTMVLMKDWPLVEKVRILVPRVDMLVLTSSSINILPGILLQKIDHYHHQHHPPNLICRLYHYTVLEGKIIVTSYRVNENFHVGKVSPSHLLKDGISILLVAHTLNDALREKRKGYC